MIFYDSTFLQKVPKPKRVWKHFKISSTKPKHIKTKRLGSKLKNQFWIWCMPNCDSPVLSTEIPVGSKKVIVYAKHEEKTDHDELI